MLSLRDAREVNDVLTIASRGLGFDFSRPCVAYDCREGSFRPVAGSEANPKRPTFTLPEIDLETLRRGAITRREKVDMVGVISDGQIRAVLALENGGEPLDSEETRYVRALAAHVSLALANALAFDQMRRYAAEGAALTEAARTILGFSELTPLAAALCKLGARLLALDRACVYARRGGAMRRIAMVAKPTFDAPESVPDDDAQALAVLQHAFGGLPTVASSIALPSDDHKDEARGLLVFSRGGRFERGDLRLIETFKTLAALAIRNVDLYEQSVRANRQLAESNSFKDDLMAMFAHDFKGPLTVISGFSELMLDTDDADVKRSAETIVEQTKRLAKLSDDALALAATQSAGFSLQRSPDDITEFVRLVAVPLDPRSGAHRDRRARRTRHRVLRPVALAARYRQRRRKRTEILDGSRKNRDRVRRRRSARGRVGSRDRYPGRRARIRFRALRARDKCPVAGHFRFRRGIVHREENRRRPRRPPRSRLGRKRRVHLHTRAPGRPLGANPPVCARGANPPVCARGANPPTLERFLVQNGLFKDI